eukprot:9388514-Karenia_brevis.AAC.1
MVSTRFHLLVLLARLSCKGTFLERRGSAGHRLRRNGISSNMMPILSHLFLLMAPGVAGLTLMKMKVKKIPRLHVWRIAVMWLLVATP